MYLTDRVRYVGDVVALIAAETRELCEEAKKHIKVEYEELPAVFDVLEAMKDGAPQLHEEYPTTSSPLPAIPLKRAMQQRPLKMPT